LIEWVNHWLVREVWRAGPMPQLLLKVGCRCCNFIKNMEAMGFAE
jgi:hypothetical protein